MCFTERWYQNHFFKKVKKWFFTFFIFSVFFCVLKSVFPERVLEKSTFPKKWKKTCFFHFFYKSSNQLFEKNEKKPKKVRFLTKKKPKKTDLEKTPWATFLTFLKLNFQKKRLFWKFPKKHENFGHFHQLSPSNIKVPKSDRRQKTAKTLKKLKNVFKMSLKKDEKKSVLGPKKPTFPSHAKKTWTIFHKRFNSKKWKFSWRNVTKTPIKLKKRGSKTPLKTGSKGGLFH